MNRYIFSKRGDYGILGFPRDSNRMSCEDLDLSAVFLLHTPHIRQNCSTFLYTVATHLRAAALIETQHVFLKGHST